MPRSLFVRHAPLRRLGRAASAVAAKRPRSTGIVGPLAIAVGLAFAGHELTAATPQPARAEATTVASTTFEPLAPERVVRHTTPRSATRLRGNVVARKAATKPAPRRPVRASRSGARKPVAARAGWVRPANGRFTSGYGPRWGRMHRGIDIAAPYGSPIYAAAAGVVTFAGPQSGYGRLVTIRHSDGTVTAYGHMSRTFVRTGQRVTAGQHIAAIGSEGRSTGPHLHFEVRRGGGAVNPVPFLRARGVRI